MVWCRVWPVLPVEGRSDTGPDWPICQLLAGLDINLLELRRPDRVTHARQLQLNMLSALDEFETDLVIARVDVRAD